MKNHLCVALVLIALIALTGCPGGVGDRYMPSETTSVKKVNASVCFLVQNAQNFQPVDISINPKGTPIREREFTFDPDLKVENDQLCIPPSFYTFPESGQFVVSYVLAPEGTHVGEKGYKPRYVVVGFEIANGHTYGIKLKSNEY